MKNLHVVCLIVSLCSYASVSATDSISTTPSVLPVKQSIILQKIEKAAQQIVIDRLLKAGIGNPTTFTFKNAQNIFISRQKQFITKLFVQQLEQAKDSAVKNMGAYIARNDEQIYQQIYPAFVPVINQIEKHIIRIPALTTGGAQDLLAITPARQTVVRQQVERAAEQLILNTLYKAGIGNPGQLTIHRALEIFKAHQKTEIVAHYNELVTTAKKKAVRDVGLYLDLSQPQITDMIAFALDPVTKMIYESIVNRPYTSPIQKPGHAQRFRLHKRLNNSIERILVNALLQRGVGNRGQLKLKDVVSYLNSLQKVDILKLLEKQQNAARGQITQDVMYYQRFDDIQIDNFAFFMMYPVLHMIQTMG